MENKAGENLSSSIGKLQRSHQPEPMENTIGTGLAATFVLLQRSHQPEPMENFRNDRLKMVCLMLQRSHQPEPMENESSKENRISFTSASTEPPAGADGKRYTGKGSPAAGTGFNGATSRSRWKTRRRIASPVIGIASTEPPAGADGKRTRNRL